MAQPTLIPNSDGARIESLPLDTPRYRCILALDLGITTGWAMRGVPYEGVPVGTIKRHAAGKGITDKDAMAAAIRARGFSPADDNEADAIAILLWAIGTNGGVA